MNDHIQRQIAPLPKHPTKNYPHHENQQSTPRKQSLPLTQEQLRVVEKSKGCAVQKRRRPKAETRVLAVEKVAAEIYLLYHTRAKW